MYPGFLFSVFFHFIRLFSVRLLTMFALRRLEEEEEERHISFSITQLEHWNIKRFFFFFISSPHFRTVKRGG